MANAKPKTHIVVTTKEKIVRVRIRKSDVRLVVDGADGVLVILDIPHPGDQELVYLCLESFDSISAELDK